MRPSEAVSLGLSRTPAGCRASRSRRVFYSLGSPSAGRVRHPHSFATTSFDRNRCPGKRLGRTCRTCRTVGHDFVSWCRRAAVLADPLESVMHVMRHAQLRFPVTADCQIGRSPESGDAPRLRSDSVIASTPPKLDSATGDFAQQASPVRHPVKADLTTSRRPLVLHPGPHRADEHSLQSQALRGRSSRNASSVSCTSALADCSASSVSRRSSGGSPARGPFSTRQ